MHTHPTASRSSLRALSLALPLTLILAACAGAAAPTPPPSSGPGATPRPTPTPVIGDPGNGGNGGGTGGGTDPGTGGGGSGGGTGGNVGGGILFPIPGGIDPNVDPMFGDANYVTPAVDLLNPRPVNVQLVRALQKDDGSVVVDLRWWSGVAPCNQLDHVEIVKDEAARTIRFTVIEGSGKGDIACIEIAQLHATIVDLGALAAGDWKLSAEGDAPQITLEVK